MADSFLNLGEVGMETGKTVLMISDADRRNHRMIIILTNIDSFERNIWSS